MLSDCTPLTHNPASLIRKDAAQGEGMASPNGAGPVNVGPQRRTYDTAGNHNSFAAT